MLVARWPLDLAQESSRDEVGGPGPLSGHVMQHYESVMLHDALGETLERGPVLERFDLDKIEDLCPRVRGKRVTKWDKARAPHLLRGSGWSRDRAGAFEAVRRRATLRVTADAATFIGAGHSAIRAHG